MLEKIKNNKSYIIVSVIVILIVFVFVAKQQVVNKSSNSGITNNDYKVYNFGSPLCPACVAMDPIYEKIKEEFKNNLNFEYIDVSKDNALAYTYEIEYTPTFIIVDKTGTEVDKLVGYVSESEFRKFINKWSDK